jgi:hypothetical protein
MNRHDRRRLDREQRRAGEASRGYLRRLGAVAAMPELRGRVFHAVCEHDGWCGIYRGRSCNCIPSITMVEADGEGDVLVVDEQGGVHRKARQ